MKFKDNNHKLNYEMVINLMKSNNRYHQAVAYLLSLDNICFEHINDIFDFADDIINIDSLYKPWQTSTSKKTTRLALNLWNGYCSEGETYISDDGFEEKLPSRYYTPNEIFCCSYALYYWEAIQIRFNEWLMKE